MRRERSLLELFAEAFEARAHDVLAFGSGGERREVEAHEAVGLGRARRVDAGGRVRLALRLGLGCARGVREFGRRGVVERGERGQIDGRQRREQRLALRHSSSYDPTIQQSTVHHALWHDL